MVNCRKRSRDKGYSFIKIYLLVKITKQLKARNKNTKPYVLLYKKSGEIEIDGKKRIVAQTNPPHVISIA